MAISKAMEELLATIKDEAARAVFRAQLESNAEVAAHFEGNLRQSDYDRQMNANKAEVERLKALEETARKWQDWAKDNVPKHEKAVAELRAKEAELEALKNNGGGGDNNAGLTEAQILEKVNKELAAKGYMSKADLDTALKAAADAREKDFLEKTFPSTMAWQSTMNDLQWVHRDEFKTPLDTVALSKFMVEKKINDPRQAFDLFVAEPRMKAREEKLTEDWEKDFRSKNNLPGTGAAPAPEMGPLEMRLKNVKMPVEIPDGTSPGDGRLASMAAQELRAEGKT